jgi:hypothetical protein
MHCSQKYELSEQFRVEMMTKDGMVVVKLCDPCGKIFEELHAMREEAVSDVE